MNHRLNRRKPTMLIILDGFGYSPIVQGNAIAHANMPTMKKLLTMYPHTLLQASGHSVGLLGGTIGNSEVGHKTIGAGRIIKSIALRFHEAISDKSFFSMPLLHEKFTALKLSGKSLHLMGLLSDAGVHSHEEYLYALLEVAHNYGLKQVFVHAFLDGRDVEPRSAQRYLERLESICAKFGGIIASIHGRFYAMDRDNNWERTQESYQVLCEKSYAVTTSWRKALEQAYASGTTDEFVKPVLLDPAGVITSGDGVVFFNIRADRARQLTRCFLEHKTLAFFITATRYDPDFKHFNNEILFEQEYIDDTLLDEIARQAPLPHNQVFIIAESEKYAHVTYFFRGMVDKTLPNETRVVVPSIKTKNYIDHPGMSASKITQQLIMSLRSGPAYFYLVNYANADMVGHSGDFNATVQAVQILDQQIALLYEEVVSRLGGTLIITADHGNAESKIDLETGLPLTAHTCNPVPFIMAAPDLQGKYDPVFNNHEPLMGLASIAPTILKRMGLTIPECMSGSSPLSFPERSANTKQEK